MHDVHVSVYLNYTGCCAMMAGQLCDNTSQIDTQIQLCF